MFAGTVKTFDKSQEPARQLGEYERQKTHRRLEAELPVEIENHIGLKGVKIIASTDGIYIFPKHAAFSQEDKSQIIDLIMKKSDYVEDDILFSVNMQKKPIGALNQ